MNDPMNTSPTGEPMAVYPGVYRAIVEETQDPQQRKRYRVRVSGNIHPPEVEIDHLPWAELAVFGGQFFGDIPTFQIGDEVWVSFESGNPRYPVIMAGIFNFAGGLPTLPAEQTGEYERTSERWVRTDRKGNTLEMSPLDEELWIRMKTPDGSEVQVSQKTGTITIRASGKVLVQSPQVTIEDAQDIQVNTITGFLDVQDRLTLRCRDQVDIRSANLINIGQYTPPDATGIGVVPAETTDVVDIRCETLFKLEGGGDPTTGSGTGDADIDFRGVFNMDVIGVINIHGASDINVVGDQNLNITVTGNSTLDCEGTITIDAAADIAVVAGTSISVEAAGTQIDVTAATDINVDAQANIVVTAGANMDVTAAGIMTLEGTGQINMNSSGPIAIASDTLITLEAPTVRVDADLLAEILASTTVRLDAGVILSG